RSSGCSRLSRPDGSTLDWGARPAPTGHSRRPASRARSQRHVPRAGPGAVRLPGAVFPAGHAYQDVHAVPGPWQADQNRVPRPVTSPETWILGPSTFSAQLAAQLGRPYAFALQFGNADV